MVQFTCDPCGKVELLEGRVTFPSGWWVMDEDYHRCPECEASYQEWLRLRKLQGVANG